MMTVDAIGGFFEKKRDELSGVLTHTGRHSLYKHSLETAQILDELLKFYDLENDLYRVIGRFLAYYHDLGKLRTLPGQPHAPESFKELIKNRVEFKAVNDPLWVVLLYLVVLHHSRLRKPRLWDPVLREFAKHAILYRSLREIEKRYEISRIDIADLFGLFKIADAVSAYGGDYRKFLKKPDVKIEAVKKLIGKVDEKRWKEQINLRGLPDVSMLRAPTGWGKTSTSILFALPQTTRVFILLPTITAINKFHSRLSDVFDWDSVKKYFFLYEAEVAEEDEALRTLFFTRSFLAPYVITTVDQFLLSFLQLGKYHTRRVAFRNSTLILDEVHLLSPVMLHLISFLLKKYLRIYRLRCLLMSATLPKAYQIFFKRRLNAYFVDYGDEYKARRRVIYEINASPIEKALDDVAELVENGCKVLLIVNTVKKAIQLAKMLDSKLDGSRVVQVLHARFTYDDRRKRERMVHELLNQNMPHVLVATQVCEVSLDVSYDELFTELAPLGSIIQRFGRVNRYGVKTEHINAHLFIPETAVPYDEDEMKASMQALMECEVNGLKNEWQLIEVFDRIFTYERLERLVSMAREEVRMDVWEELLENFFSFDIREEELRKILEYRDQFTTLAIPDPKIVLDQRTREALLEVIEKVNALKHGIGDYEERVKVLANLKRFLVPVPFRYVSRREPIAGFPIIRRGSYHPRYGFLLKEGLL